MLNFLLTQTPLKFLVEGIWRDEAFSYLLARNTIVDIVGLTVQDFNPPLYYFLLHTWMIFFGASEISMRSLSLLFYVLGVFCVYEIFKVILNRSHKETIVLTLAFALNPLLIYYAFETRMYSMLFCLAMAASFYYLKKDWRNYVIIAVIGLYTHYFMGLVIFTQIIHTCIHLLRKKITVSLIFNELKFFGLIFIFFIPWVLLFLLQNVSASSQYWIVPLKQSEIFTLAGLTYSGIEKDFSAGYRSNQWYQQLVFGFSFFYTLTAVAGYFLYRKHAKDLSVYIYFVLLSIIPLVLIVGLEDIKPLYVPRYVVFVSAAISVVLLMAIARMKILPKIIILGILVVFSLNFQSIQLKHRNRGSTKAVIEKIKPLAQENDLIYVTTELDYMTAQYYYGVDKVFIYGKKYEEIPSFVGKVLIPSSAIVTSYPYFPVKAFVLYDDHSYEVKSNFR